MNAALTIHFAPVLPPPLLIAAAAASLCLLIVSLFFSRRAALWRTVCTAAFLIILMNPSLVEEERKSVPDIAAIIVDRSPSQMNGDRTARTDAALARLRAALEKIPGLDLRVAETGADENGAPARETRLFGELEKIMGDVPPGRRAGAIVITDGQVHDVPAAPDTLAAYGPVHTLLTGRRGERDRQLEVIEAPAYGIVGQTVTVRYRIVDSGQGDGGSATVIARVGDSPPQIDIAAPGEERSLTVAISHAGQNVVDLEVSPLEGEITEANNRAALIVNGVRDRLRVLLVSGQPYAGGRTWRDLLTADPGVDLVHFTILREPDKLDATPQNELSLIAFPFRELFEVKLYDFDLIVFDRYRLNRILPNYYFSNIANYVRKGGALLEESGPSFAGDESVYGTALKEVLPAYPTGEVLEEPFRPAITDLGRRHPVTGGLHWTGGREGEEGWGSWLRQVTVQPVAGDVLMTGARSRPLLVLDRVGQGRVAQLASDQIWLWSRGYEGGGPQAELLRRLAHWLMKEPELEENALDVRVDGGTIVVTRRSLRDSVAQVELTTPRGEKKPLPLETESDILPTARFRAEEPGVYTVDDGTNKRYAVVGDLNQPELRGVVATAAVMTPVAAATGGGVFWLADGSAPAVRMLPPGRSYGGIGWLGLRKNDSYDVEGVRESPVLPPWLCALAMLVLLLVAWWREGRSRSR